MDLTPVTAARGYQCEATDPRHGDCCGAPAVACDLDAPNSFDMSAPPRFLCAHHARRAELDSELQAMGAVVIQVEDLGAALDTRFEGNSYHRRYKQAGDPEPWTARIALGEVRA